jgi:hypothetical protein
VNYESGDPNDERGGLNGTSCEREARQCIAQRAACARGAESGRQRVSERGAWIAWDPDKHENMNFLSPYSIHRRDSSSTGRRSLIPRTSTKPTRPNTLTTHQRRSLSIFCPRNRSPNSHHCHCTELLLSVDKGIRFQENK